MTSHPHAYELGVPVNDNPPDPSGPRPAQTGRTFHSEMTDRERERRSAEALHHLGMEVVELVSLRGRLELARTILARGGDRQAAIDALDGKMPGSEGV